MVIPEELKPFWSRTLKLTTEGDCLLWGTRVIIPQKLYAAVLQELHTSHPGIVHMKVLLRNYVWWPGLDKAIEKQLKTVKIANQSSNLNQRFLYTHGCGQKTHGNASMLILLGFSCLWKSWMHIQNGLKS